MKLEVTIGNQQLMFLVVFAAVLAVLGIAGAYNLGGTGGNPAAMGHSVDEIDWSKTIPSPGVTATSLTSTGNICFGSDCRTGWSPCKSVLQGNGTVATGAFHSCAVMQDKTVRCWGYNGYGQLGTGDTTPSYVPLGVVGLSNAIQVDASYLFTCAVKGDGTVWCWGYNNYGQLGDGTTTQRNAPVQVSGITTAVQVAVSDSYDYGFVCAALSNGKINCWGYNGHGELGNGGTANSYIPVEVSGITDAKEVDCGFYHCCARLATGAVKCWGYNNYGQLGDTTTTTRTSPVQVSGLTSGAVDIGVGAEHSCAVMSDGTVKCWGYNGYGECGDGTTTTPRTTPVQVLNINNALRVDAFYGYSTFTGSTCAVLSNNKAKCWGYNGYGKLGDGTTTGRTTPVDVVGAENVVDVSMGYDHTCYLFKDSSMKCVGTNSNGQFGDSTTNSRYYLVSQPRFC